jgi:adhesin HecA-like repeat protein
MQNIGGTLNWLNNSGVGTMTLTNAGALAVSGGFSVNGGTLSLPSGSITTPMIANNAITSADLATNALTIAKQIKFIHFSSAAATIGTADCGAGFTAISADIATCGIANGSSVLTCPSVSAASAVCDTSTSTAPTDEFWLVSCAGTGMDFMAVCIKQ